MRIIFITVAILLSANVELLAQLIRHKSVPAPGSLVLFTQAGGVVAGNDFSRRLSDYSVRPILYLGAGLQLSKSMSVRLSPYWGKARTDQSGQSSSTLITGIDLSADYAFCSNRVTAFFLEARITGMYYGYKVEKSSRVISEGVDAAFGYGAGVGLRFRMGRASSMMVKWHFILTTSDKIDGFKDGMLHDGFSMLTVGYEWYFSALRGLRF